MRSVNAVLRRSVVGALVRAAVGATLVLMLVGLPAPRVYADDSFTYANIEGTTVVLAELGYTYSSILEPNHTAVVNLHDGSLGVQFMFHGEAGRCVRIVMKSPDFDPFLVIRYGSPNGEQF